MPRIERIIKRLIRLLIIWILLVVMFNILGNDDELAKRNAEPRTLPIKEKKKTESITKTIERNAPGAFANPVVINVDRLSPEERKKYEDGWKYGYNEYASNLISLHRELPDFRDPE
jgi:hypothetical protein